ARLSDGLASRLRARASAAPWTPADAGSLAHGWLGVAFALLAHGAPTEPWFARTLADLAAAWSPAAAPARLAAARCNGAAGACLAYARAFATVGDPRLLDTARAAARTAIASPTATGSLCCGDAGVGFALLALARVDPGAGWRDAARDAAVRAIANPR